MTTVRCSFRDATGLPHLCVTLSMRKADIHMSHLVLRVAAMNEKLSVTFLTSDWVLSKLLLFSTHSSTDQAFSIQTCPSERVWARTKMLKSQGWISCKPGGPGRKRTPNTIDMVACGVGQEWWQQQRDAEKYTTGWKSADGHELAMETDRQQKTWSSQIAAWLCQQRKENKQSTQTESEHFHRQSAQSKL